MSNNEKIIQAIHNCIINEEDNLNLQVFGSFDLSKIPDLQKCTHLKSLKLGVLPEELNSRYKNFDFSENVFDLNYITNLKNLENLVIYNSKIINIEALSRLDKLCNLNLNKSEFKSLERLNSLRNLRILSISGSKIENFKSIDKLLHLEELIMGNTFGYDLAYLSDLINLKKYIL